MALALTFTIDADGLIEIEVSGTGAANKRRLLRVFTEALEESNESPKPATHLES